MHASPCGAAVGHFAAASVQYSTRHQTIHCLVLERLVPSEVHGGSITPVSCGIMMVTVTVMMMTTMERLLVVGLSTLLAWPRLAVACCGSRFGADSSTESSLLPSFHTHTHVLPLPPIYHLRSIYQTYEKRQDTLRSRSVSHPTPIGKDKIGCYSLRARTVSWRYS